MARALLVLAALLLAVPGVFVGAKGVASVRTRSAVVQGRTVTGAGAVGAGLVLLGWAAAMIAVGAVVLAAALRR